MRKRIGNLLKRQVYNPSWWGVFFNPNFIARYCLMKSIERFTERIASDRPGRWLDVGCGEKPYRFLFDAKEYIGIEVENEGCGADLKSYDLLYDGKNIPFGAEYFDGVICTQVLEHVFRSRDLLAEMARVLKPGGYLILTAPFFWEEHEQPRDYVRFTRFGLEKMITLSGFEIIEHRQTSGYHAALAQMASVYLYGVAARRSRLWNMFVTAFLCAPVQIAGLLMQKVLPRNERLYLDHAVLARKL